ncbi:MAG: NnrU family protein [Hasllibacter sp.]
MGYLVLIAGLALFALPHFWKRAAPASRARWGEAGKGAAALVMLAGIVLMVIGYRWAAGPVWWGAHPALVGINNLLVLIAVYLFVASLSSVRASRMPHPQLHAVAIWAVAHLLPNGEPRAFVLFGGLLAWAVAEIVVLNRAAPGHGVPDKPLARAPEWAVAGIALGAYALIAVIHGWIGPWPFG